MRNLRRGVWLSSVRLAREQREKRKSPMPHFLFQAA